MSKQQALQVVDTLPALPQTKLYIPYDVKETLFQLCEKRPLEWTIFGKTEFYEDGVRLVDFRVPKQSNSGAHSDVAESDLLNMVEGLANEGEDLSRWNVWIHSHNKLGAFFSGTDTSQMDDFAGLGVPIMFSIVVSVKNNKRELLAWASFYKPLRVNVELTVTFERENIRETGMEELLEIEAMEARLAELKAGYREIAGGWFTELNTEVESKTEKPKPCKGGYYGNKKQLTSQYYDDDDYGYYYAPDTPCPMFDGLGELSEDWAFENLYFNDWMLKDIPYYSGLCDTAFSEELDTYSTKESRATLSEFLGLLYTTKMVQSDMKSLVFWLAGLDDNGWADFIIKWSNAITFEQEKYLDKFEVSPFTQ